MHNTLSNDSIDYFTIWRCSRQKWLQSWCRSLCPSCLPSGPNQPMISPRSFPNAFRLSSCLLGRLAFLWWIGLLNERQPLKNALQSQNADQDCHLRRFGLLDPKYGCPRIDQHRDAMNIFVSVGSFSLIHEVVECECMMLSTPFAELKWWLLGTFAKLPNTSSQRESTSTLPQNKCRISYWASCLPYFLPRVWRRSRRNRKRPISNKLGTGFPIRSWKIDIDSVHNIQDCAPAIHRQNDASKKGRVVIKVNGGF